MPCSDDLLVGIKISSPAGFRRVHFSHVLISYAVKRDLRKLLFTGIYDSIMDLQQKNENNFLWLNCALCFNRTASMVDLMICRYLQIV